MNLWGENRGKWQSRQSPEVEPRTPLAWAASSLPLSHDSWTTTNPHNCGWQVATEAFSTTCAVHIGNHGCQVATEAFSTICAVHIEDCEGWWLSGCRGSVAEHWQLKPGTLGLTPGDCWLFHFLLFSPHDSFISSARQDALIKQTTSTPDSAGQRWNGLEYGLWAYSCKVNASHFMKWDFFTESLSYQVLLHTSYVRMIHSHSRWGELGMRLPYPYHVALECEVETICGKSMTVGRSSESKRMLNSLKSQWMRPQLASLTIRSIKTL